jgi:dihydroflavonol-4-reductase
LCRGSSSLDNTGPIEVLHGDIISPQDVDIAVAGVDEIYHLAGIVSRDPGNQWLLYRTHIQGTRNVCEAARRHGVKKIVAVSSSGTIAVSRLPVAHREDSGYKYDVVGRWPYYLSKIYAEKLALGYFREFQLPVVVVNPSLLLGPGDDRGSSTGDVALFLEGQIMAVPLGGINFVDARDAARGAIAAMRSGRVGERYLLGGPNWAFREFVQHLSRVSGVPAPKLRLPLRLSLLSAAVLREVMPWVGKSFPLDDVSIRMSALFWYCDSSKAHSELGFDTRDPIETLQDTVVDIRQGRPWGNRRAPAPR